MTCLIVAMPDGPSPLHEVGHVPESLLQNLTHYGPTWGHMAQFNCPACCERFMWLLRARFLSTDLRPVLYPEPPPVPIKVASHATLAVTRPGANGLVKPPPPETQLPSLPEPDLAEILALVSAGAAILSAVFRILLWLTGFWT